MVRTKADSSSVKAACAKLPRKFTSCPTTSSTGQQNTGGNPYFPRETPSWQKEITNFFKSATVESRKKRAPTNESRERSMEVQEDSSTKHAQLQY